jgi:ATP-dependent RNA helicase RhlE
MTFENLKLIDPILRALKEEGYASPTPIQEQSIPVLLQGKDLIGCAQTGTGKISLPFIKTEATKIRNKDSELIEEKVKVEVTQLKLNL